MVGIVIVSHSAKVAEGTRELAMQMASKNLKILAAGGLEDGSIGTDAVRIQHAAEQADSGEGVCILADLGSGILSAQTALEFLEDGLRDRTRIADAPIVEGTISAAVSSSIGSTLDEVVASAEEARGMQKLS
jgi:PTS hybrid protein